MSKAPRRTVFVGNITEATTSEHLAQAFAPFGAVTEVQIPEDLVNRGSRRNFGFVTFARASSALDAVDNMNLNVLPAFPHKILKVNLARTTKGGGDPTAGTGLNSKKAIWEDEKWLQENEANQDRHREPDEAGTEAAPAPAPMEE